MINKMRIDLVLVVLLCIIPIVIWSTMEPLVGRFNNYYSLMTSLGQLTSLVGTVLIAISMILQVKLSYLFSVIVKPANITSLHHDAGVYGVVLVLLHPVLLALRFVTINPVLGFKLLYSTNLVYLLSLMALIIMVASTVVAVFVRRSFGLWKIVHQTMLLSYLGVWYHLVFVSSDISENYLLRIYILVLLLLGGLAFAWQKGTKYLREVLS